MTWQRQLVSVQSVVIGPLDHLWILDTGNPMSIRPTTEDPISSASDLTTDKGVKKILFPQDVTLLTTYLNDVQFDLRRGSLFDQSNLQTL